MAASALSFTTTIIIPEFSSNDEAEIWYIQQMTIIKTFADEALVDYLSAIAFSALQAAYK